MAEEMALSFHNEDSESGYTPPPAQAAPARPDAPPPLHTSLYELIDGHLLEPRIRPENLAIALETLIADAKFAGIWHAFNQQIVEQVPLQERVNPVLDAGLAERIGQNCLHELQRVASAWGDVVKHASEARNPQPSVARIAARFEHPAYLDDESLPVEVGAALRARDLAGVSYRALARGARHGARPDVLIQLAEEHLRRQRRWLDFLVWTFDAPRPSILPAVGEDWPAAFQMHQLAEGGLELLLEAVEDCPEGLCLDAEARGGA